MSRINKVAFEQSDEYLDMVKELGGSKSTIYFKIDLIKMLDKYPKLKELIVVFKTFKDYPKTIK